MSLQINPGDYAFLDCMKYRKNAGVLPSMVQYDALHEARFPEMIPHISRYHPLVIPSVKLPHDYEEGTDLVPFVNWAAIEQPYEAPVFWFEIYMRKYKSSLPGEILAPTELHITNGELFPASRIMMAQYFTSNISGAGQKIGSILSCSIFAVESGGLGDCSLQIFSFGFFYKSNSIGSKTQNAKG